MGISATFRIQVIAWIISVGSCFNERPGCIVLPNASKACPDAKNTTRAVYISARSVFTHLTYKFILWQNFFGSMPAIHTALTDVQLPRLHCLYSGWGRTWYLPCSCIWRFKHDFARTCFSSSKVDFPSLTKSNFTACISAHSTSIKESNSSTLSMQRMAGYPRLAARLSSTHSTR